MIRHNQGQSGAIRASAYEEHAEQHDALDQSDDHGGCKLICRQRRRVGGAAREIGEIARRHAGGEREYLQASSRVIRRHQG